MTAGFSSDRRIFFVGSPAQPRSNSYYNEFATWAMSNLGVIRSLLDEVDLSQFDPRAPAPMTEAKKRLVMRSANPLVQDIKFLIDERKGPFDRDIVTLDDVAFALGGARAPERALGRALQELGAVPLGQQRVAYSQRKSLWIIRNAGVWVSLTPSERAEEFGRQMGLLAPLEGGQIGIYPMADFPAEVLPVEDHRPTPMSDEDLAHYVRRLFANSEEVEPERV